MGWGIVYPPYSVINMGVVQPPTPTTRWVYNSNGVDSYIQLNQEVTFTGDFELSMYMQRQSVTRSILGGDGISRWFEYADGRLEIANTSQIFISGVFTGLVVGEVFKLTVKRVAGVVEVLVNGVSKGSAAFTDTVSIKYLGKPQDGETSNLRSGYIFDYQDSLGNKLPINDRTFGAGAPIANSATVLGSELLFNNDFSSQGSGWSVQDGVSFANGLLVYDGVKNDVIWQNVNVEANTTYIFEIKVIDVIRNGGNQPRVQLGNGAGYTPIKAVSDGVYKVLLKSTSTGSVPLYIELGAFGAGAEFSVDYVSLKEANGYATGVNLLESGWTEIPL